MYAWAASRVRTWSSISTTVSDAVGVGELFQTQCSREVGIGKGSRDSGVEASRWVLLSDHWAENALHHGSVWAVKAGRCGAARQAAYEARRWEWECVTGVRRDERRDKHCSRYPEARLLLFVVLFVKDRPWHHGGEILAHVRSRLTIGRNADPRRGPKDTLALCSPFCDHLEASCFYFKMSQSLRSSKEYNVRSAKFQSHLLPF